MTRPLVIAHRGASAELPENTLPAFERAIELGADLSSSTCTRARTESWSSRTTHPAGRRSPDAFRGARSLPGPDRCDGRAENPTATGGTVWSSERSPCSTRMRLSSASRPAPPLGCARCGPSCGRCSTWATFDSRGGGSRLLGCRIRQPARLPARARAAHGRGLATTVYTVNDPRRLLELAALGVTGIFTDDPRRALQCLGPSARQRDQARTFIRDVSDHTAPDRERLRASGRHVGDQLAGRPDHLEPRDRAEERVRDHLANDDVLVGRISVRRGRQLERLGPDQDEDAVAASHDRAPRRGGA